MFVTGVGVSDVKENTRAKRSRAEKTEPVLKFRGGMAAEGGEIVFIWFRGKISKT